LKETNNILEDPFKKVLIKIPFPVKKYLPDL